MTTEIAMPFHIGRDGQVVKTDDIDRQVRQHVQALINTHPHQRAMVPGYGVEINNLLFENSDAEEITAQSTTLISSAFADWEPGLSLDDILVDSEDEVTRIDVSYSRKDAADSGIAANTNTAIISANGEIREVVRG